MVIPYSLLRTAVRLNDFSFSLILSKAGQFVAISTRNCTLASHATLLLFSDFTNKTLEARTSMMLEKMLIGYDKRLRPDFGGI